MTTDRKYPGPAKRRGPGTWTIIDKHGAVTKVTAKPPWHETVPAGSSYAREVCRRMSERVEGVFTAVVDYGDGEQQRYAYHKGVLTDTRRFLNGKEITD